MSGGTASMSGRTSGKHRLTGAKIALKGAKTTNLKGSQGSGSDDSSNLHLYNIRAVVDMACGLVKAAAKQF